MSMRKHLKPMTEKKKPVSKFTFFNAHFEEIYGLRKEGYSYQELRDAFENEYSICLTTQTFREYYNRVRRVYEDELLANKIEKDLEEYY